jgi:hypothetical protein
MKTLEPNLKIMLSQFPLKKKHTTYKILMLTNKILFKIFTNVKFFKLKIRIQSNNQTSNKKKAILKIPK